MESLMRRQDQRWIVLGVVAPALWLSVCLIPATAQTNKQSDAEKALIEKAQALESRGRPDIAVA